MNTKLLELKRYDVITFEDDEKIVVLESIQFEGQFYVYVNEILQDETDVTDVYKVMVAHPEDGTLEKITDHALLRRLLPIFQRKLEQDIDDENGRKGEQDNSLSEWCHILSKRIKGILLDALDPFVHGDMNSGISSDSTSTGEKQYFNLINHLVDWQRKHHLFSRIAIMKDYIRSTKKCTYLLVVGYLEITIAELDDITAVTKYFSVGKPFRESASYAFYQSCGPFESFKSNASLFKHLRNESMNRYPDLFIDFSV